MELRSRLRSCNVFITTGIDFNKNCNLKISIQSNCIILNYYNDDARYKRRDSLSSIESLSDCYSDDESDISSMIPLQEFCRIIPNSMSCLKIDKNTISFRILTEPKNGGNFYTELLPASNTSNSEIKNELKINIAPNENLKIVCSNCSNAISNKEIIFERILELPSANLDMSEWFCHNHSHGNSSQNDVALKPLKNDFLYRLTYFVIDVSNLAQKTNKFNSKRDIYHCNRCLAWLGMKEKDRVKFFNSEVRFSNNDNEKQVFTHKSDVKNVHINDFIYTIEKMTKEFNLGLQYTVMCKIVLECTISATNKQYLMIWIMDKELQVLRNFGERIFNDKILLKSTILTKILYKLELSLNEEVESWLADPTVVSTDVSKNMFSQGLEHLQNMSLKVPESFRYTNGYCVSYLKM